MEVNTLRKYNKPHLHKITIVIPTLNEALGVRRTISKIPVKELKKQGFDYEILVVDGGSTDETVDVARSLGAKVIIETRKGYGRAYKTGFKYAQGDIIVTLDGDGSYPAEYIPYLVALLIKYDLDFITVDRLKLMKKGAMDMFNKLGNFILTLLIRLLFNVKIEDSQSGMWIFRKRILKKIMPTADGMPFSEEIKIRAFMFSKRVLEVSAPYYKRLGRPKLKKIRDGIANLIHIIKLFVLLKLKVGLKDVPGGC